MSEGLKCFEYISENTPVWVEILQSLELKIKDRQREIERVPVPSHKLKRTGSNESIRPQPESEGARIEVVSAPQPNDVSPVPKSQQMYIAKRKRKTASLMSHESGPSKYRTRSMIIVYYDSEIQAAFEQLVRHIGSGRNLIRKARMAARMEALTSGSNAALMSGSREGYAPTIAMFRSARGPGPRADPLADSGSSSDDGFGLTDAALEKAQSFCERGAHQFLRDGDCNEEIVGARTQFEETIRLSMMERARLKEDEEQRRREQEEKKSKSAGSAAEILNGESFIEADDDSDDEDFDETVFDFPRTRLMAQI